jgi:hypothetical protein
MLLEGSSHCGAIRFRVESETPYHACYCSICRKTAGAGALIAAPWCMSPEGENERRFALWPEESIAEWHRRHEL